MINWFKKGRIKKVENLEKNPAAKLIPHDASMKKIFNNSKLQIFTFNKQPAAIILLHSIAGDYYGKNRKKPGHFKMEGLEIKKYI